MIIPKRLIIQSFLSIGYAEVELSDQGLVLIEGVNEDDPSALSNGSGKSSLVDAVSWCLYGQTARGATADSVINAKHGSGTFVEMEIEIDGDTYHIARGRKHKTLRNRVMLRRGVFDLTLGTDKLTQQRINGLLGCSVETFNAAVYMGQENMPDLPNMTDKALKMVLEEALSLDRLDAGLDIVNERIADTDERNHKAQASKASIKSLIDATEGSRERIEDALREAEADFKTLNGHLDTFRSESERDLVILKQRESELAKQYASLPPDIDHGAYARGRNDRELKPLEVKLKRLEREVYSTDMDFHAESARVQAMRDGTSCDACGRPFEHDHTADIAAGETKIQALNERLRKLSEAHKKLSQKISDLDKNITEELDAGVRSRRRSEVGKQVMAIRNQIDRHEEVTQKRVDELSAMMRHKVSRATAAKKNLESIADELRDLNQDLEHAEETLVETEKAFDVLGKVKHALGRKGFRGEILDQVTPYLNARTAMYLETLTDGCITAAWSTLSENSDGDYTENFHIDIKHSQSGVDRFAMLSGGEKRKVRLACALALQDLVATRAVKPIKLFIADEIDDAIDSAGLELLMGVLEAKARDIGTVFVISHNDISDQVRNHITVTKKDGISTFSH